MLEQRHADVDGADIWTATCGVCAMLTDDWAGWQRDLRIIIDGLRPLVDAHDRAWLLPVLVGGRLGREAVQ